MCPDILFYGKGELRDFSEERKQVLRKEIESYEVNYILNVSEEDFCQPLISKYLFEAPRALSANSQNRVWIIVVGSLGFEPRIANAPGWYTKPLQAELNQDTQILLAIRRPQQPTQYEVEIVKTIAKATKEGKEQTTINAISHALRQLSQKADLKNPEEVKTAIATALHHETKKLLSNQSKDKLCFGYNWFCKTNGIQWEKPRYKWERKIPLIPTTENINKIISASTEKYAIIFTILAETGLETQELATIERTSIDTERGIINATGCKHHNSRSIKLKPQTAEMLRRYLTTYTCNNPFPNSHAMGEAWRDTRKKVANNLNQPELKNIPLRNLRHHFATYKYDQTKDILLIKQLLGHKKIETTMFYIQLITFNNGEEEYTVKTATNIKEVTDLLEHGFTYIQEIDGIKLYRKRK
jgi:integrase/recombinase XerD